VLIVLYTLFFAKKHIIKYDRHYEEVNNMVGVDVVDKVEERRVVVLENCGEKIFGVLHLPAVVARAPVVLICHGLAGHKTGKFRVYVDLATQLAKLGIATMRFDYRGCGDSEGLFYDITPEGHYSDALICLDYLKNHPRIDNSRIGIYGRSFGGTVAVKAANEDGSIKAMSLWCPMFSGNQWQDQWQLVQQNTSNNKYMMEMMMVNSQQGSYKFFDAFFNINIQSDLINLHQTPLLHIHGEADTRINMQHALDYETCRREASATSKFIKLPNTDHDFSHFDERFQALEETAKWFSEYL